MQKAESWADQMSFYRFWDNPDVKESSLINSVESHCVHSCIAVSHLLLIEDTTELNLESHRSRISNTTGLGLVGNDKDLGFFCHPTIAVNACDHSLLGVLDLHLFHREESKSNKHERGYKTLPFSEKESYRWPERAIEASKRLTGSSKVTIIQDREGDIYESFCLLAEKGLDFVIRSNHDRNTSSKTNLKSLINGLSSCGEYELEIKEDTKNRKKREAKMQVRYDNVELCRPKQIVNKSTYPSTFKLQVVYVKESPETIPAGESGIEWVLYTTHPVSTLQEAIQVVIYYKLRWMIEDLFRAVKSKGVNYESSQLESGAALRKLFVVSLMAAIQILQLRQARQGDTQQKTQSVFTAEQITYMEMIMPHFEGKTQKQKNPHPPQNLAWATWLIARMGGWKVYLTRPPGVIILMEGWRKFNNMFEGWKMAEKRYV